MNGSGVVFAVFIALFVITAVVFPINTAKKSGSVYRGIGFAAYTAVLIFAAIAIFLMVGDAVFVLNFLDESLYNIFAPVSNFFAVYFITRKFGFIDGIGKRILYSLLTTACMEMCVFSILLAGKHY